MSTADKLNYLNETKEAIKTALVEKGVSVLESDTFRSYADKIGEISSGGSGGASTKYGLSLDNILGDVDENGVLQAPTSKANLNFAGVTNIGQSALSKSFKGCSYVDSITFPNLTKITNQNAFDNAFYDSSATSVSFPVLNEISAQYGCYQMFYSSKQLTSADLSNLSKISGYNSCSNMFGTCSKLEYVNITNLKKIQMGACTQMFYSCSALKEIEFTNLDYIAQDGVNSMFSWCSALSKVSFPKLTSLQNSSVLSSGSTGMFYGCNALTEIHFRADMQSQIEAQVGYSSKFGATNATIYFDL